MTLAIGLGDLAQVGDLHGVVTHIGLRSTRLVTPQNVELVLPNSSFLNDRVTNLSDPEPFVLFTDFGSDALQFESVFWVRMRRMVESELRFTIDELFHQTGVVIAFPHRDVHLDASRPLRVQITPAAHDGAHGA